MMDGQLSLPEGDIVDVHGLLVEADRPTAWAGNGSYAAAFVGDSDVEHGVHAQIVHVVSPHVGGEIRGYVLIEGGLRLRLPCYTGHWRELDDAVAQRTGSKVVPYRLGAGGMEAVEVSR